MPRRAFVADLGEAVKACAAGEIDLHDLQPGDDDGDFKFSYGGPDQSLQVEAHVRVDDYPTNHTYFIFTSSENVEPHISKALETFSLPEGVKLVHMLAKVAKVLGKATAGSLVRPIDLDPDAMDVDVHDHVPGDQSSSEEELDSEYGDVSEPEEEEDRDFSSPPPRQLASTVFNGHKTHMNPHDLENLHKCKTKLRKDILTTKQAGFRVGLLGDLLNPMAKSFLIVSCRISRLGISQEAMQAWHLDPSRYLTLVIQFTNGYRTLQQLSDQGPTHSNNFDVQMRVGTTKQYKITLQEANDAFRETKKQERKQQGPHVALEEPSTVATGLKALSTDQVDPQRTTDVPGLNNIFISRPVHELLNQRLPHLIKYRVNLGMPWGGAELYYNLSQGRQMHDLDPGEERFIVSESTEKYSHLPKLVTNDHLNDTALLGYTAKGSFPLLAMQFTLRHVVRCTEFCLVCHVKIDADFEALKPYVCSNPLCLYQYLNLGMGPAIEHDILTQPDVVDLLVSFCYTSSRASRLKHLPIGMTLLVPYTLPAAPAPYEPWRPAPVPPVQPPSSVISNGFAPWMASNPVLPPFAQTSTPGFNNGLSLSQASNSHSVPMVVNVYPAKLNQLNSELLFDAPFEIFRPGDWIYVVDRFNKEASEKIHYKVLGLTHLGLRLGPAIHSGKRLETEAALLSSSGLEVEVYRYDRLFDDLSHHEQLASIGPILNTLPSIADMGEYLRTNRGRSLEQWTDRISPTALGLLRWIIASNRSCIVQVDNHGGSGSTEERVGGMANYLQFRFAQGAPDKEQRFINAVRENSRKNRPQQATIFAWHGSGLYNWHGIVREGLNFEETVNGRAYGHGVYHSLQANTSLGYSGSRYGASFRDPTITWRQSRLQVEHALSLNEIVNSPSEFVSSAPHLVVSQLDWIQTRYLFVKCGAMDIEPTKEAKSTSRVESIAQDPRFTPQGATNEVLRIPITAVSKSRRPEPTTPKIGEKRSTTDAFQAEGHIVLSDDTDAEDLEILHSDVEIQDEASSNGKKAESKPAFLVEKEPPKVIVDSKMTDFVPGTVDHDTLPLFDPPEYATPQGLRTLQRQLKETLKTQATTPVHQLGWYIDPDLVTNLYQWIIELHTFDASLPIHRDLQAKKLKSIVLEFRFGASFPFSPPFVRVIRPRFLPLMQGGGGHVTAGGAMCMQLLTNDGWSSVNNMESVLLQIKLAIESTEPKPARLESGPVREYGIGEAVEAFRRACRTHGWTVPEDFGAIAALPRKGAEGAGPSRF